MKASIENIKFGKYYLKEIEVGTGYLLDENNSREIDGQEYKGRAKIEAPMLL